MKELDKFRELMTEMVKGLIRPSTVWATVKEVDWDSKTMVAISIADGLEFYDVLLGLGNAFVKPVDGTLCLLGAIEGKQAATFMIWCQEAERNEMYGDNWVWNDGTNKGFVKLPQLVQKMNVIEDSLNDLKQVFVAWCPSPTPDSGAALKTAAGVWAAAAIVKTLEADLENQKLKH